MTCPSELEVKPASVLEFPLLEKMSNAELLVYSNKLLDEMDALIVAINVSKEKCNQWLKDLGVNKQ